jgi:hypothetical protein
LQQKGIISLPSQPDRLADLDPDPHLTDLLDPDQDSAVQITNVNMISCFIYEKNLPTIESLTIWTPTQNVVI